MTWEDYEKRMRHLRQLCPDTSYEGIAVDRAGNPVDLSILFAHSSFLITQTKLSGRRICPKVTFSLSPVPNAFAKGSSKGSITVNLGIVLFASRLPRVAALLESIVKDPRPRSFSEIESFHPSDDLLTEIKTLVSWFREMSEGNWRRVFAPASRDWDFGSPLDMFPSLLEALVVFHELGHLLECYMPSLYAERLQQAREVLDAWVKAHEGMLAQQFGLSSSEMTSSLLENWAREIDADRTAYGTIFNSEVDQFFGMTAQKAMGYQIAMAFFYFVLQVIEFASAAAYGASGWLTHPPVSVRRDLFTSLQASNSGMNYFEFMIKN